MQDDKDNINQAYADWGEGMSSRIDEDIQILKRIRGQFLISLNDISDVGQLIDDFREIQRLIRENFI